MHDILIAAAFLTLVLTPTLFALRAVPLYPR